MTNFSVIIIPMKKGQFCYYIHPTNNINGGYYVDPGDKEIIMKHRADFKIKKDINCIITTDSHEDRCGSNLEFKELYPELVIMGGA